MSISTTSNTNIQSSHNCVTDLATQLRFIINDLAETVVWAHHPRVWHCLASICFMISSSHCWPKIDITLTILRIDIAWWRRHSEVRVVWCRRVRLNSCPIPRDAQVTPVFGCYKWCAIRYTSITTEDCLEPRLKRSDNINISIQHEYLAHAS